MWQIEEITDWGRYTPSFGKRYTFFCKCIIQIYELHPEIFSNRLVAVSSFQEVQVLFIDDLSLVCFLSWRLTMTLPYIFLTGSLLVAIGLYYYNLLFYTILTSKALKGGVINSKQPTIVAEISTAKDIFLKMCIKLTCRVYGQVGSQVADYQR